MTRRSLLLAPFAAGTPPAVTVHGKARALAEDAVTTDWTRFLGPTMNGVSAETKISRKLPPKLLWEMKKGAGYTSPAIRGERLVYLTRNGGQETITCLHPETAVESWRISYATTYEDRYGYSNGPRSSPVIDEDRVYTLGAQGMLHCLALDSGKVIWKRNVNSDFQVPQDFFGTAGTPLIEGDRLILNVGAIQTGASVVALDKATGKDAWRAGKQWGPSYASPMPATIHGKRRVMVFAGGESQPPSGGLMSIDPANGKVDFSFPWRSRSYESVNASCPVIFDNKVFVSASYKAGGALVEIQPDFSHKVLWTVPDFGMHFSTPAYQDGYLYGFEGRNEPDASLACLDAATGKVVWREVLEWNEAIEVNGQSRTVPMSPYRGSLLKVDGGYLCLGERGHLLWLELTPKGVKILSRTWLFFADQSWSAPVISHGLLYISQNSRDALKGTEPRLLCYDVRA